VAGEPVELTRLEFDLLDTLSAEPRVVFSKEQLLDRVWGSSAYRDDHVVAVHIANLRRKLGDTSDEPRYVRTVHGVGYRMVDA
jgi:DNA-binding response OmpR family regulator